MGARVERTDDSVTVSAGEGLRGIDADLRDAPELTTVLTALAALADGPSRFSGVAHIRLQETDRLAALAKELNPPRRRCARAPGRRRGAPASAHRRRHGAATTTTASRWPGRCWALGVDGVQVLDVATTRKTVPDFVGSWTRMLGKPA
jgi:3-phosphoshikimate 1-carboxyvinyltransferase